MIDITKKIFPESVEVKGKIYPIHTDFQYFIRFSKMMSEKHKLEDFDFLYKSKIPYDRQAGLNALIAFAFPKSELPRNTEESSEIIFDYELDADLIYSAFYHYYGIDIIKTSLHWYSFSAMLNGLKDCKLTDVMEIRAYKPSQNDSKEHKARMNKLKAMWKIEAPLTEEEKKSIEKFERLASGTKNTTE